MSDVDFWAILIWFFLPEYSEHLEKKVWFRFLHTLQIITIAIIILCAVLLAYTLGTSSTQTGATLVCNDGTKWSAMTSKTSSLELDPLEKCGLCTKRTTNQKYYLCEYGDDNLYTSYQVKDRIYKANHSFIAIIGWTALFLFGSLLVVKGVTKSIIYIIAGRQE